MKLKLRLEKMDLQEEARELVSATQQTARRGGQLLNRIADMTGKGLDAQAMVDDAKALVAKHSN